MILGRMRFFLRYIVFKCLVFFMRRSFVLGSVSFGEDMWRLNEFWIGLNIRYKIFMLLCLDLSMKS